MDMEKRVLDTCSRVSKECRGPHVWWGYLLLISSLIKELFFFARRLDVSICYVTTRANFLSIGVKSETSHSKGALHNHWANPKVNKGTLSMASRNDGTKIAQSWDLINSVVKQIWYNGKLWFGIKWTGKPWNIFYQMHPYRDYLLATRILTNNASIFQQDHAIWSLLQNPRLKKGMML